MTYSYGRCELFKIQETFAPLEYLMFAIQPPDEKMFMFVFEDGEEHCLNFHIFFNPISVLRIHEPSTSKYHDNFKMIIISVQLW